MSSAQPDPLTQKCNREFYTNYPGRNPPTAQFSLTCLNPKVLFPLGIHTELRAEVDQSTGNIRTGRGVLRPVHWIEEAVRSRVTLVECSILDVCFGIIQGTAVAMSLNDK
jgi:hypothetical protein